ncbi:MAG TPA: MBOAT family O-acyltransferase [Kofleriaceae bacterium]|nr:MBOAT family O-acyltransferase [Kofleriaceae bacterium]
MLFSSPDYPLFLIAVFFLYALARWGGPRLAWARIAVMVLLGDVIFMLVAKDPAALWDPIGGVLLRLVIAGDGRDPGWSPEVIGQWIAGAGVLFGGLALGRRAGGWIGSAHGQRWIARAIVAVLAALGVTVLASWRDGTLDATTALIVEHGHLLVLFVLGTGLGASTVDAFRPLGRVVILFVASALFYHAWAAAMPGPYRYLLGLLLATIVLDYYLGRWIEDSRSPARRKALVVISLCSNLGILVFFKYADFFTQDVLHLPVRRLDLILPAGISFHTFQSLSYTIDVYRKQLRATRSVIQFATFVLFFPQLVAGPIVRAQDLLPQLDDPPALELEAATAGLFRIVVGLFKKVALADALALSIVDRVFEAPERFSALEVLAGVYGYALQIYLDFSAYSDIAIGSAQVLGFTLPENFATPYRSANLQEFWRRWHISLSTWLRDYLYITLGGNHGAPWRTYLNLFLTMVLGGLWHGASWAFIVWGALHGAGLAVTRYFQRAVARDGARGPRLFAACAALAIAGGLAHRALFAELGTWPQLVIAWLYLTPVWAVATAWLSSPPLPALPAVRTPIGDALRFAMCAAGLGFLAALARAPRWTWIPLVALTWALGLAADVVDRGRGPEPAIAARLGAYARRAIAVVLVFQYVCLAWIFFRASSFDNALGVLRQLATGETDHANLVPLVTCALAVGFACHFFADGSFRWLRDRFVALPAWAQGAALAAAALVLRELGQAKLVPFIYFQF